VADNVTTRQYKIELVIDVDAGKASPLVWLSKSIYENIDLSNGEDLKSFNMEEVTHGL
jgi:hypothetical protein